MNKSIIISGFEPFGGDPSNITEEVLSLLPDSIGECKIHKIILPVIYGKAGEVLLEEIKKVSPFAVISLGQAAQRLTVTPERYAKNIRRGSIADNAGQKFNGEEVISGGPDVLESIIDPEILVNAVLSSECGIGAEVSLTAGRYVCNDVMYTAVYNLKDTGIKYAFVHIPCRDRQAVIDAVLAILTELTKTE